MTLLRTNQVLQPAWAIISKVFELEMGQRDTLGCCAVGLR